LITFWLEMRIDPVFPERIVQRFYVSKKNNMGGLLAKHLRKYFSSKSDKLGMPTGVKKRLMGHSTSGDVDLQHYSALTFDELKEIYDRYWGGARILSQRVA
jgi:intergrase/recombinase